MESDDLTRNPDDPTSVLVAADQARQRLAAGLRLPPELPPTVAAATAVQLGTAAYGIASQTATGLAIALAGFAVFLGVAVLALHRFRQVNGVRIDGLASQIILGTGAWSTTVYVGAFVAATWAAFDSRWWLVAVVSVAGGVGYAFGIHQWWRAYRQDPSAHAGGVSPWGLAALAAVACLGLAALLVSS